MTMYVPAAMQVKASIGGIKPMIDPIVSRAIFCGKSGKLSR